VKEAYKSLAVIGGNIQTLKYVLPLGNVVPPYDPGEYLQAKPDRERAQEEAKKQQRENYRHQQ